MPYSKFTLIALLFLSLSAFAGKGNGGWVSSGGEVFKNAKNPWFVKNTLNVTYCVQFSAPEFSISEASAMDLIEKSLDYWKDQFDKTNDFIAVGNPVVGLTAIDVATQNFIYSKTCEPTTDIVFKFGYKNLAQDEIDYLVAPTNYLGVTIRKDYDEVNLKGTGVVYISGDLGAQSYVKSSTETIDKAWQFPKLLQYVIIHELGHVFGVPHTGSGIMSEVFLDQLLVRKTAALYVREPISPFIKSYDQFEICDTSALSPKGSQIFAAGYFNIKSVDDCIKLVRVPAKKEFKIYTRKKNETDVQWAEIGKLFVDANELVDFSLKPAVILQVSDKQTIFKSMNNSFMVGPVFQNYKVDGHITLGNSMKPYPVQIDLSPDSFVIYGNYNNQVRQVLTYGNPFLYSLLNPF